jgi:3-dehydroquinate dehydratase-2
VNQKARIIIINGPNLNLLGKRETNIYGNQDFDSFFKSLQADFKDYELAYYQSNVEGELINKLHEIGFSYDYILLNAGGYTHTSVALSDAVAAIQTPVIEVHISNPQAREDYRHTSLLSKNCKAIVSGFGLHSYATALAGIARIA